MITITISDEQLYNEGFIEHEIECAVRKEIATTVKTMTDTFLNGLIKNKVDTLLNEEVENILSGVITVSNGWDSPKKYESLNDFVKVEIKNQITSGYQFAGKIERVIKDKVSKIIGNEQENIVTSIANYLSGKIKVKK